MGSSIRIPAVMAVVLATLFSATTATALAQGVPQVRAGSEVAVANSGECRPNADVVLFFEGAGVAEVQVGSAVSDAAGSFETRVVIPPEASSGTAAILVDCGLDGAVLTYDLEVASGGFVPESLVGPALIGLAVIALVGLGAVVWRRRGDGRSRRTGRTGSRNRTRDRDRDGNRDGKRKSKRKRKRDDDGGGDGDGERTRDESTPVEVPTPAPAAPSPDAVDPVGAPPEVVPTSAAGVPVVAGPAGPEGHEGHEGQADEEDGAIDDGADYWFWEAATSAGPRRRVACMTERTFHLHEVSVDAFQAMLDRLVEVGPDVALSAAFIRIPVAAIDRVVRDGTVIHIEGRSAGGPRRQSIDLADGAEGVVEMLARRVPIVDATRHQEAVR